MSVKYNDLVICLSNLPTTKITHPQSQQTNKVWNSVDRLQGYDTLQLTVTCHLSPVWNTIYIQWLM